MSRLAARCPAGRARRSPPPGSDREPAPRSPWSRQRRHLRYQFPAEIADPGRVVGELRRLDADGPEPPGELRRDAGQGLVEVGEPVGAGEGTAGTAHVLQL